MGRAASAPSRGQKGVDQGVDQPGLDPAACRRGARARPRHRRGMAASPTLSDEARPLANSGLKAKLTSRPATAASTDVARIAGHHDDRTRLGRERRFHDPSHDRLAVELRHELGRVRAARGAKARRLARGSTMAPTLVTGRARLRTRTDLHQQPADAHRADVRVADRTPASTRCRTQSKPFSFGDRAQPGAPMIGTPWRSASSSRLPGSTGMPNRSMRPPIASMAAGMTSRRSVMAEAPNAMSASLPSISRPSAFASGPTSCGTISCADDARSGRLEARLEHAQRLRNDRRASGPGASSRPPRSASA